MMQSMLSDWNRGHRSDARDILEIGLRCGTNMIEEAFNHTDDLAFLRWISITSLEMLSNENKESRKIRKQYNEFVKEVA